MNFQRNADDERSDPSLVEAQYSAGRSAALEVELTLAELESSSSGSSGTGGASGSAALIATLGTGTGGNTTRYGGCPEISQRLLTKEGYKRCDIIYDRYTQERLFNPLTGNYNRIIHAEITEQPIVLVVTESTKAKVSESHHHIRNTQDYKGTQIALGNEQLIYTDNAYINKILAIEPLGMGLALEITLENEWIYVVEEQFAHNSKIPESDI